MFKAYKYRIYPTPAQKVKIEQTLGVCRLVYNLALETRNETYRANATSLSAYDLQKQLTVLKKDYPWMCEVDSQALQASIKKIDTAFKGFFNGKGFPKFKSKKGRQSFQCPNSVRKIDFEKSLLTIPKIPNIPIRVSREFKGKIKTITISKTVTCKYFASILVDNGMELPSLKPINPETTIGIDTGIKSFVISSDGRTFKANRKLKDNLQRLKVLQHRASRKKKGSINRKKANLAVALLHEKISNKRNDYIHKVTHKLTNDSQVDTICVEDLNIKGMVKNHSLSQAINDASLGELYRQLNYKCLWNGKNVIMIDRFAPSSKRCSCCGNINCDLTLADREWICIICNTRHDRDENASQNIKFYGLEKYSPMGSRGEPVELLSIDGAKKQENNFAKAEYIMPMAILPNTNFTIKKY